MSLMCFVRAFAIYYQLQKYHVLLSEHWVCANTDGSNAQNSRTEPIILFYLRLARGSLILLLIFSIFYVNIFVEKYEDPFIYFRVVFNFSMGQVSFWYDTADFRFCIHYSVSHSLILEFDIILLSAHVMGLSLSLPLVLFSSSLFQTSGTIPMLGFSSRLVYSQFSYSLVRTQDRFIPFWINYSFDNSAVLLLSLIVGTAAIISHSLFICDRETMCAAAIELHCPEPSLIGECLIYFILLFDFTCLNFFLSDHITYILKFSNLLTQYTHITYFIQLMQINLISSHLTEQFKIIFQNIFYLLMNKSRLLTEDKVYVKFDKSGNTSLASLKQVTSGYSYRRVHDTHEAEKTFKESFMGGMFQDKQYQIKNSQLTDLDTAGRKIVIRRLSDLVKKFSKNSSLKFFPSSDYLPARKLSKDPMLPAFATQLGVFPVDYYKSYFLTQDFSKEGRYHMIINQKGRFQTDMVDDLVPVYEDTLEPIWGMQLDQAWEIILLKFWAKRCGGYNKVKNTPPYVFLQYFSNSNWKYYNLHREGFSFLSRYVGKTNIGKIILKTKNTNEVYKSGLIPNSAGYQMTNLIEVTNETNQQNQQNQNQVDNRNRKFIGTIRSTMNNKWAGKMSVIDPQINKRYFPQENTMALQRDFMITQYDLINLFSSAYVASKRDEKQQNYISDYYTFKVEPNNKKSIYIKFTIPTKGWFDFCIKQFEDNRVKALTAASQIKLDQFNKNEGITGDGTRYLKIRYLLVKQNGLNSPSTFEDWDYEQPKYDTYEIEYSHGYNRGDARFLQIVPGTYILKIKPETINKPTYFTVNYASNSFLEMSEYFPVKQQSSLILRQAMSSLIGILSYYHLDKNAKYEQICYANTFQEIGYGFVGVRSKKSCPYRILIEVDPSSVRSSGYKLKNQFKNLTEPFSIVVKQGECTSIVLKKIEGKVYEWPPKGIEIFKQKS